MYLRTTRRRNADGSVVEYHQLAENVWDPDKACSVAKVIYNFGRGDPSEREAMRRLARSILRVFGSEETLAEEPGVKILDSWPYGGMHVLNSLWHELGIDQVLTRHLAQHGVSQPFERALFALVANRALRPYSKLYCHERWLRQEVFYPGFEELELHHLYGAMDFLEAHTEDLEKEIYFRTADLFKVDVDLIFYDTTSLHCEIDEADEAATKGNKAAGGRDYPALRKRGKSKNGRGDVPQIVVGLAVTREGLPVRSWIFPGNTNDVTTVEQVKNDLRGWKLGRCVFVGDAGMNSEANRHQLALGGGKYILASRMRAEDEVAKDVLTRAGRYHKVADNLEVKEVVVGEGERRQRYVVCHNPKEEARQRRHREKVLQELEQELATLKEPKEGAPHSKRTCELLTRDRYKKYLRQTAGGTLHLDRTAIHEEEKLDGKWVVTSNDDTLTAEDLALGYKQLLRVEECWRTMKSGLRMRPFFHRTPHRIHAHVRLCVLALLLERVAELRAKDTWRNLLATLETVKVVEYERGATRVRQTSEVRSDVAGVLRTLHVPLPPVLHKVAPAAPAASASETAPAASESAEPPVEPAAG